MLQKSLSDTQSQQDFRNQAIDCVGIKELRYPLKIETEKGDFFSTVAQISLGVNLDASIRGTHMSRFIEVLNDYRNSIKINQLSAFCDIILDRLDAPRALISFSFPYFKEKKAPVTGKLSLMDYQLILEIEAQKGEIDLLTKVVVPVKTLCPCSKEISNSSAHNQRAHVSCAFRLRENLSFAYIDSLISIIESSSSSELFSLLKREDEKFVTEAAYESPVFVEDLLRNVAVVLDKEDKISYFRVDAENFESIHNHNAFGYIVKDKRV